MIKYLYFTSTATITLDQSGPVSNGNAGVLYISQSSKTGVSPSDGLVLYSGHSFGEGYSSAEMQSVYSIAPADNASRGQFSNFTIYILSPSFDENWSLEH